VDESLFRLINDGLASPTMDWIMIAVTTPDTWLAPGVLLIAALFTVERKKGVVAVLAAILAVGVGDSLAHQVIKPMVGRARPCAALENVHMPKVVGCTNSFSFPSNHAVNTFAFAAAMGVIYPKMLFALAPIALLVALSRVALGVHYPADVAVGGALGIAIGVAMATLAKRLTNISQKKEPQEDG